MYRDLNLRIPNSLYFSLEQQAFEQGVSLETLCLSLLSEQKQENVLVSPDYYSSLGYSQLREEVQKVIEGGLSREETRKRVNGLEFQISRRFIR
jgi:hypothetical protein